MPGPGEILFVAYGGGHMRMLVPVAAELAARGAKVTLLPLTVGVIEARASGLPMVTPTEILATHPECDRIVALGKELAPASGHPAVSDEESWAYHGIGLLDLIVQFGEPGARDRFDKLGRKAFEPVDTWAWILDRLRPDVLVSTTSPRSELAAFHAAKRCGIPSVCVTDHFLVYEMDYVSLPGHGDRICVLGKAVADALEAAGRPEEEIRVTGNPAFDPLFDPALEEQARILRNERGWHDRRILLWPQESGTVQVRGKPLFDNPPLRKALDKVLASDPRAMLLIRPHPNATEPDEQALSPQVQIDRETPVDVMVHMADQVVGQCTTVCLQAGLIGKPVVTVGNGDMPPFARYGLALDIPEPAGIPEALARVSAPDPRRLGAPSGSATIRVADIVEDMRNR